MKLKTFVIFCVVLISWRLMASESMLNSASPLPKGNRAWGFSLGLDLPVPLFYGVGVSWGLANRYELGVVGSFIGIAGAIGVENKINFLKDDKNSLSFIFIPSLYRDGGHKDLLLNPALAYQLNFGQKTPSAFFLKFGTISDFKPNGEEGVVLSLIEPSVSEGGRWFHAWKWHGGFQWQLEKKFAFTVEGGVLARMNLSDLFPLIKLGFSWGF